MLLPNDEGLDSGRGEPKAESRESVAQKAAAEIALRVRKGLLRFNTCGSVDDGKSTLIGRLLFEAKALFDDQLATLESDSKRVGTRPGELDYALLLDGLAAEREQGITIDVAYRFFSTERRNFIVADTPGHEQYTRNMVTGASTADLSVILVDARKGILTQTRRHSFLVSLLGIRHVVLVVNKMDLVTYSQSVFARIEEEYREFAKRLGIGDVTCIPISAVYGDNIMQPSRETAWYRGPTLMGLLDTVEVDETRLSLDPFRMPVQWVNRPNADFRGFAGTIVAGTVRPGMPVVIQPSGKRTRVARIVTITGDLPEAGIDQSVLLTLEDEVDVSRGDVIATDERPCEVASQFLATIVWLNENPLARGREYFMKIGARTANAAITPIRHKIDINTLEHCPADKLELNEIGVCEVQLDRPISFDPYVVNRDTGGFILIDRLTHETIGAGMLHRALRQEKSLPWQSLDVHKAARSALKGQQARVLWYTGLPGVARSTIAKLVDRKLHSLSRHSYLLDTDALRHGPAPRPSLFDTEDASETSQRGAEIARLMVDAGLIVSATCGSPLAADRQREREQFEPGEFIEIFVESAAGSASAARQTSAPEKPEIRIDAATTTAEQAVEQIVAYLAKNGAFEPPNP